MKRSLLKIGAFLLLTIYTFIAFSGATVSAVYEEAAIIGCNGEALESGTRSDGVKISSRLYELFFGNGRKKENELMLIPCGDVFGIKIKEEHVTVGESETGSALKKGDKIISVNGKRISDAEDIKAALNAGKGSTARLEIIRGNEKMTVTVTPREENGSRTLGIKIRKSASGIGTITFIHPESMIFGGLGHGVCDPDSGAPVSIKSGDATKVILGSTKRGESGAPGELSGILSSERIGSIDENNDCGVFGALEKYDISTYTPLPVANKNEVKPGEAEIISTVKNGKRAVYKIEITDIDRDSTGSKSFKIKVTDPMLLTLTGGIVRGMSGSPIIQDGKIIGAVTHVMVADPTEGYGIFIENMLASIPKEQQRAA